MSDPAHQVPIEVTPRRFDSSTIVSVLALMLATVIFLGPRINVNVASFVDAANDWSRRVLHLHTGLSLGIATIIGAAIIGFRDVKGSLFGSRRWELAKNGLAILLGVGGVILVLANLPGGTAAVRPEDSAGIMNLFGWLLVESGILIFATNGK